MDPWTRLMAVDQIHPRSPWTKYLDAEISMIIRNFAFHQFTDMPYGFGKVRLPQFHNHQ